MSCIETGQGSARESSHRGGTLRTIASGHGVLKVATCAHRHLYFNITQCSRAQLRRHTSSSCRIPTFSTARQQGVRIQFEQVNISLRRRGGASSLLVRFRSSIDGVSSAAGRRACEWTHAVRMIVRSHPGDQPARYVCNPCF